MTQAHRPLSALRRSGGMLSQRGLTLVELMISITLGLIILAALVTVFSQNSRSYRQNDAAAQLQDNARFAMETLARDLATGGYLGGMFNGLDITVVPSAPSTDCGPADSNGIPWAFRASVRFEFQNDVAASAVNGFYPCLVATSNPVVGGTDMVVVRRANGQSAFDMQFGSTSATLNPQTYYLMTNGTQASIVLSGTGTSFTPSSLANAVPQNAPMSFFQWFSRIYFIRSWAHNANDGIPALCRMDLLNTPPSMNVECLADGIDDMQIEWGLGSGPGVSVPTFYTSTPTCSANSPGCAYNGPTSIDRAVTARIWLLARSTQIEAGYVDTKLYSLAGKTPTAPPITNGFHHRVYTTTVNLRNTVH